MTTLVLGCLSLISDLCVDDNDYLYASDQLENSIRVISPSGEVTTLQFKDEVTGATASLQAPTSLCLDGKGQLWVGQSDCAIRLR